MTKQAGKVIINDPYTDNELNNKNYGKATQNIIETMKKKLKNSSKSSYFSNSNNNLLDPYADNELNNKNYDKATQNIVKSLKKKFETQNR